MKHLVLVLLCSFAVAQENKKNGSLNSSKPDLILVVNQASTGVLEIVDQVSKFVTNLEKEQLFSGYILIPFRSDEDIKQTDAYADSIFKHFANLESDRTKDSECKDNSLTQIKRALDTGKPNSVILVFTDSNQEDAILEEIKSQVRANHTRIFTFSLLKKDQPCRADPKMYVDLGLINNGQFLETSRKSISDVLNIVKESLKPNRVQLLAIDDGTKPSYELPVDASMEHFFITASKTTLDDENFTMNITDQDDKPVCKSLVSASVHACNNKTLSVKKLKISLKPNIPHSLRISAVSDLSYKFGFEDLHDRSTVDENVYSQPINDIDNTFILQVTGASKINISSFEMTTLDDSSIDGPVSLTLAKNKTDVYYCTFKPSEDQFRVKIRGTAANNNEFQFMLPVTFKSSDKSNKNTGANDLTYIKLEALVEPKSVSAGQNPNSVPTPPTTVNITTKHTTESVSTSTTSTSTPTTSTSTPTTSTSTHKPSSGPHHSASLIMASLSVLTVVISAIYN